MKGTKKVFAWVMTFALLLSLVPAMGVTALAVDGVSYRYPVYNKTTGTAYEQASSGISHWVTATKDGCTSVTTGTKTWGEKGKETWYVVDATVGSASTTFTVNGDVHLILMDGKTLTAKNIVVDTGVGSLTIYGQSLGTGSLNAAPSTQTDRRPGIGGGNTSSGPITINGGNISAKGGIYAAGIGGANGSGTNITINGGTVSATGGTHGAGIGGGYKGAGQYITINGGTVKTARGGVWAAGIGGGGSGAGQDITINGGTVTTAQGGSYSSTTGGGAGIGGGYGCVGQRITINRGDVTATGGTGVIGSKVGSSSNISGGAGIGGGGKSNGEDITINGGTVTATGGQDYAGAGIGGGREGSGKDITINGGTVTANSGSGSWFAGIQGTPIKINGGTVTANGSSNSKCGISGTEIYVAAKLLLRAGASADPISVIAHEDSTNVSSNLNAVRYATVVSMSNIQYLSPVYKTSGDPTSGLASMETKTCSKYIPVTASITTWSKDNGWSDGWYVVNSDVTISGGVTVSGEVHLILTDGHTLTVNGVASNNPGIKVSGNSDKLTIYAQSTGNSAGALTVTGGSSGAGIGGGNETIGQNITINGGRVTATGGGFAAGIGGGRSGTGQNITINNGNVTAQAGSAAGGGAGAGIGGGSQANGQYITINGGTVSATSRSYTTSPNNCGGAGIGGGSHTGIGQYITINGGDITATGGDTAAGIGGGSHNGDGYSGGVGNYITITGGTVHAHGGGGPSGGAGIGGGKGSEGQNITITGGTVYAYGNTSKDGYGAAGIGGGRKAHGRNIEITDGTVYAYGGIYSGGIGGGSGYAAYNITITGGSVTAEGGDHGEGIGGREDHSTKIGENSNIVVSTLLVVKAGTSANPSSEIIIPEGGNITADLKNKRYATVHEHKWDYTASGDTITRTCSGGCGTAGGSFTVNKPNNLDYTGLAKDATLAGNMAGVTAPGIEYKQDGKTLSKNPMFPGTYTANITVQDKTASTEFTISSTGAHDESTQLEANTSTDADKHLYFVFSTGASKYKHPQRISDLLQTSWSSSSGTITFKVLVKNLGEGETVTVTLE